jgi:hydrogenase nickel incorporation protein HypB
MSSPPRLVEVRQNVLKQNDLLARALRQRFQEADVFVISMVSTGPVRQLTGTHSQTNAGKRFAGGSACR